jgi:hypothetical protein
VAKRAYRKPNSPALLAVAKYVGVYFLGRVFGAFSGFRAGYAAAETARPRLSLVSEKATLSEGPMLRVTSSDGAGFLYVDGQPVGIVPPHPVISVVRVPKAGTYNFVMDYGPRGSTRPEQIQVPLVGTSNIYGFSPPILNK